MNLYEAMRNDAIGYVDPLGLSIYIQPVAGVGTAFTSTQEFSKNVMSGFRQVVGDSGAIGVEKIIDAEGNFKAWKIVVRSENAAGKCSQCWKQLKDAINSPLDINIQYDYKLIDNGDAANTGNVRSVNVNPASYIFLAEVPPGYQFDPKKRGDYNLSKLPFPILLWHEAIGHAALGLGHPNQTWNNYRLATTPEVDPTIVIENMARECLRLNGIPINDRYPKYYGIPR